MRFDSLTALIMFLGVVASLGYQPPFLNRDNIKKMLPGRINYYTVTLKKLYDGSINIMFAKDDHILIINCPKEE